MNKFIEKTYTFAKSYHSKDNSGHGFDHIDRVYQNALKILKHETTANNFIVEMSALLHDIDDRKLNTDGKNTERFLDKLGIQRSIKEQILETIDAISFSKSGSSPTFKTIEMQVLSDADKLDAIGAIGICRAIMFGTNKKRPLFDKDQFPKKNLTKEEYKDLTRKDNNSINHFFDKLLKLQKAMQTQTGKREAKKRHDFMVAFLTEFFEEQNLNDWILYLNEYYRK